MSRVHYWQNLIDTNGNPIDGASIYVYLANSSTPAYVYKDEITGSASNVIPQLTTSDTGYFEFWIGDSSEGSGYSSDQKFKLVWEKIGVASGMVDNIDIFPLTLPVDVTSDDTERNKSVSNLLAKRWEAHRTSQDYVVHGIEEVVDGSETLKRNKLVSDMLAKLWNDHRLTSFDGQAPPSATDLLADWEPGNPHGLKPFEPGADVEDVTTCRIVSSKQANEWTDHVEFDFSTDTVGVSGFDGMTPHGLMPCDFGTASFDPSGASDEELEEHQRFNKLVSNEVMEDVFVSLSRKAKFFEKEIKEEDWHLCQYAPGYNYTLTHGLGTPFPVFQMYKLVEIQLEDGTYATYKAVFQPQDIFIVDDDTCLIYVNKSEDINVVVLGRNDEV